MEENRERSWSQLEYIYITTMRVLSLIWSWLLYQWFCRFRVLKVCFLLEHRGKLPLQLGSIIPLKAPKLHCFDSLAEYSIFAPVLVPGGVLVQYLGLCDLAGWVSQWCFYADAWRAIEWCSVCLPLQPSSYPWGWHSEACVAESKTHWGVSTSFSSFICHSFASSDCISSPSLQLCKPETAGWPWSQATPATCAQGLAGTPQCGPIPGRTLGSQNEPHSKLRRSMLKAHCDFFMGIFLSAVTFVTLCGCH